jgi:hypothetical protein
MKQRKPTSVFMRNCEISYVALIFNEWGAWKVRRCGTVQADYKDIKYDKDNHLTNKVTYCLTFIVERIIIHGMSRSNTHSFLKSEGFCKCTLLIFSKEERLIVHSILLKYTLSNHQSWYKIYRMKCIGLWYFGVRCFMYNEIRQAVFSYGSNIWIL